MSNAVFLARLQVALLDHTELAHVVLFGDIVTQGYAHPASNRRSFGSAIHPIGNETELASTAPRTAPPHTSPAWLLACP